MTDQDRLPTLFDALPRRILLHYFVLCLAQNEQEYDSALRLLMEQLKSDSKIGKLLKEWGEQGVEDSSSTVHPEERRGASQWKRLESLMQAPGAPEIPISQPRPLVTSSISEFLYEVVMALEPDRRFKGRNTRSATKQDTKQFCVDRLLKHTRSLPEVARRDFRREDREQFCRHTALREGRQDLLVHMTENLFTKQIIPEVNRRLREEGAYIRARRPKKDT